MGQTQDGGCWKPDAQDIPRHYPFYLFRVFWGPSFLV